jgi:hypothetical protein
MRNTSAIPRRSGPGRRAAPRRAVPDTVQVRASGRYSPESRAHAPRLAAISIVAARTTATTPVSVSPSRTSSTASKASCYYRRIQLQPPTAVRSLRASSVPAALRHFGSTSAHAADRAPCSPARHISRIQNCRSSAYYCRPQRPIRRSTPIFGSSYYWSLPAGDCRYKASARMSQSTVGPASSISNLGWLEAENATCGLPCLT